MIDRMWRNVRDTYRDLRSHSQVVRDWLGFVQFDPHHPSNMTKFRHINAVRHRAGALTLVETGTYSGETTRRAARVFDHVFSVELDDQLFARAQQTLAHLPNVTLFQGDATEQLPLMLDHPQCHRALVYLDAHFSGGVTAHGDVAEPAIEELVVLAQRRDQVAAVIVDDFRCFGTDPDTPTKAELVSSAESLFAPHGYTLHVHSDQLVISR